MNNARKIQGDLWLLSGSDRRLALFENVYPIPRGVSYNAYVLLDEQTVLLDTVDAAVGDQFLHSLEQVLSGRPLDYIVVNHMEPDHCAMLGQILRDYPRATVVCNAKTQAMIGQFFSVDLSERIRLVSEGDTLCTGRHTLAFVMAPMVHWPEAMVSYDVTDKVLFSADAFGSFGAPNGAMFADEVDFQVEWLPDARRYFTNIVGKYGGPVQTLLKKAAGLDIAMICPLHGPLWRRDIGWFVEKYLQWSSYTPEMNGVMIAYGSIYGHTAQAAEYLAAALSERGVRDIAMFDVSVTHPSYILAEAFRRSHLVFASATYNMGLFPPMESLLIELKAHALQQRRVALIENGTWAPAAGKLMRELLSGMKDISFVSDNITIRSAAHADQEQQLSALAEQLAAEINSK